MITKLHLPFIFMLFTISFGYGQMHQILDTNEKTVVSYATVSFGNGNGIFADADGKFVFSTKTYPNIDSLHISAMGYKERSISTIALPQSISLEKDISQLQEVIVTAENLGKYKIKKQASKLHDDYFRCWLPTVESEIAVFFPGDSLKNIKIASVFLPIKMENSRGKSGKKQSFSTLFKMQFYANANGYPGKRLSNENVVFQITNNDKTNFEIDVLSEKVYIPKDGIFIGFQVLGYTDKQGKLQHTKKYHEVETRKGIVKISTTFRPLLPFTDQIEGTRTFTRRIFYKNRNWQPFDKNYSEGNNLIKTNHRNYGMGIKTYVYTKKTA